MMYTNFRIVSIMSAIPPDHKLARLLCCYYKKFKVLGLDRRYKFHLIFIKISHLFLIIIKRHRQLGNHISLFFLNKRQQTIKAYVEYNVQYFIVYMAETKRMCSSWNHICTSDCFFTLSFTVQVFLLSWG
jgi:hypothetical protein